jgi:transcriptional regulator with XRE-family HTH domain
VAQDEHPRVQRIKQYVLARLRDELATAPRGAQAQLAKKLGVSGAHLSNMLSASPSRQPGEDFRRKVSAHWGITYAQLEALALGEEPPAPASTSKPVHRSESPPNLEAALADYRWMPELPRELRNVVRDQAKLYYRIRGDDYPREEWRRVVTGLEREALGFAARHPSDQPTTRTGRHRRRAER